MPPMQPLYGEEQFGPISFVVATADTSEAIDTAVQLARSKGAITGSVYSTNEAVLNEAAASLRPRPASTSRST